MHQVQGQGLEDGHRKEDTKGQGSQRANSNQEEVERQCTRIQGLTHRVMSLGCRHLALQIQSMKSR